MFLHRQGFRFRRGRLAVLGESPPARFVRWLYWDVWWPSRISYRLTLNPRTFYLASFAVAWAIVWLRRHPL